MGIESPKEVQYSIELNIDKEQYAINDQIKGYVSYYAHPFLYQAYNQSFANYNLELRLQFQGFYEQHAWESLSEDQYTFVFKEDLLKNCLVVDERKINEKVAFVYDLDLISTSAYESSYFQVNYSIIATIQHKQSIILKKELNFLIYRPYVDIERPVTLEHQFNIKSMICCNFGQINVKASLNKTDFHLNEIANILIECDSTRSTQNIMKFQFDLFGKSTYSIDIAKSCLYNSIEREGMQDKKCKFIQKFPISSLNEYESQFHSSLDNPNFCHQYCIQITCSTGIFTNPLILQLPIIIYQSYEQNQKNYRDSLLIKQQFDQNFYDDCQKVRQLGITIVQDKWNNQTINFPEHRNQIDQQQQDSNMIIIQSQQ